MLVRLLSARLLWAWCEAAVSKLNASEPIASKHTVSEPTGEPTESLSLLQFEPTTNEPDSAVDLTGSEYCCIFWIKPFLLGRLPEWDAEEGDGDWDGAIEPARFAVCARQYADTGKQRC